jgi:hypothetical protein
VNEHVVVPIATADKHDPDGDPPGPVNTTLYTGVDPLPKSTVPTDHDAVTRFESAPCDNVTVPG